MEKKSDGDSRIANKVWFLIQMLVTQVYSVCENPSSSNIICAHLQMRFYAKSSKCSA